jgi:hypothetical protein
MRFGIQMLIVLGLGLILAMFMPWWSIALAGAVPGFLIHGHRGRSFLAGFVGALLLWAGAAIVMILMTGSDLGDKFALLLPIPLNGIGLAFVSGIIGGLVGGFGGFTGDSLRRLVEKQGSLNSRARQ